MTTETLVIWNPLADRSTAPERDAYCTAAQEAGKTDNIPVITYPDGPEGVAPMQVARTWTTHQDAQDWVDFLATYNPQSAIVV